MKTLLVSRAQLATSGRIVLDVGATLDELRNTESQVIDGSVWLKGVSLPLPSGMTFQGEVGARWTGSCVRCADEAQGDLKLVVDELFTEDHEEGETYPVGRDFIDLEPMIRELLMLELPQMVRCSETCKGVCAQCGTNRNRGTCSCLPIA